MHQTIKNFWDQSRFGAQKNLSEKSSNTGRDPGCPIVQVPNHRLRDYLPDSVHHNFQIFIDP